MWSDRNHKWKVEVKIALATLFSLPENRIENAEELQDPFLTPAMACSWVLNRKRVKSAIPTPDRQAAVAQSNGAY